MKRGRNPTVWTLVLLFILADIGIGLWLWDRYQTSQKTYSNSGLNVRYLPEQVNAPTPQRAIDEGRETLAFRDKSGLSMIPQETYLKLDRAGQVKVADRRVYKSLWKGARAFVKMAGQSRYRHTKAINEWSSDFRTYPDLAGMAVRFQQDKDIHLFLSSVVRSQNFAKMIRRYGSSPDVQNFYKDALKNREIAEAAQAFFEDKNIFHSVQAMKLPGLPSIGALMAAGAMHKDGMRWDKIGQSATHQNLQEQSDPKNAFNDRRRR